MQNPLNTFVFVYKEEVISSVLTTTREYGRWLEELFDSSICQLELYCKSKKKTGESVLEMHPGTRIGEWFGKQSLSDNSLLSWYIYQESTMMDKLKKMKLAEYRDAIPISVNDEQGRRMLRLYSIQQIELYIRSNIDKKFNISQLYTQPKQIKIRESDFNKMVIPQIKQQRRKLF